MPESPEVRIETNKLQFIKNKIIIEINWNSSFQKTGIKNIGLATLPLTVIDVWCRGKVIVIETKSSDNKILYITSQLGMSGKWLRSPEKHSNFWISFGTQADGLWSMTDRIWYDDQRHFGSIGFHEDLSEVWNKHGPCLMTTALVNKGHLCKDQLKPDQLLVTYEKYRNEIRNKRYKSKRIAEFMMDQSRVSGVGNYIRNEVLYRSKISPIRLLTSLSDEDIKTLYETTLNVMYMSYMQKGNYNPDVSMNLHTGTKCGDGFVMFVYKRTNDPLGYPVQTFMDKNKRMCYYVPEIQK